MKDVDQGGNQLHFPFRETNIPPILDRRAEANRVCAQCHAGRPDDLPTIPVKDKNGDTVYVHDQCLKFWKNENVEAAARNCGARP